MMKQWNRRRRYYDVVSSGHDPFEGRSVRRIEVKEIRRTAADQQRDEKIRELRNEISGWISSRNLSAAARVYLELMELDGGQILPPQYLLDIANQLTSENKPAQSARAYEQFLANYGSYEYVEQVELMLGILYSRYLNQADLAVKHLQAAVERLTDPGQLKMCREELAKLRS
jgi:outer membrane protein assembly factor BamD (BamD/ComL family)